MMKPITLALVALTLLAACGHSGPQHSNSALSKRIVCISKQYNEIIWALGAQQPIVGVDLSSIYPPAIQQLPHVGYHRDLSVEGILSLKPDLVIHDNNIGPESVMRQLAQMNIPIKTFQSDSNSIAGTEKLIRELGTYFNKSAQADALCHQLNEELHAAEARANRYTDTPRVAVIHFGRIGTGHYLVMTDHGTAAQIIQRAGGKMAISAARGMVPLSAEVFSKSDPDIILVTDYGFDKLGSAEKVKELPGIAETKAARHGQIYRVWEHDLAYFGPRTGAVIMNYQQLLHGQVSPR